MAALKRYRALFMALTAVLMSAVNLTAGVALEYQVKASLMFNILHFVHWPILQTASTEPLRLCILGENRFGQAVDVLAEETVAGRKLEIREFAKANTEDVQYCNVAYFIDTSTLDEAELLAAAQTHGVLTFGESPSFSKAGGIVRFYVADEKVRFAINMKTANPAGIYFSSKLLRLAQEVIGP